MSANHLIELLPRSDRARLLSVCEPTRLALSEVLYEPGGPAPFVYFPIDSFISLVTLVEGHLGLEVGMVGNEGMAGAQLALGVRTSAVRALVQGAGGALRVSSATFRGELRRSTALKRVVNLYLYVLLAQLTTAAACLRFHQIGPRLARWLLMTQDRAQRDSFAVTQEFLAYMLGVRRVGITAAAGTLQREGLIEYSRGKLTVLDRARLEHRACICYAADRQTYNAQL